MAAIGFGLIVGAAIWWSVDHPSDAPPTTAGPVSTALGTVEHGLMYPIPARKRWVLAVGSPIFGAIFVVLVPGMRADGEGLWWFVGGFGLLMVVAAPWLIKLARNPSYLAATRSGITYHGARRTTRQAGRTWRPSSCSRSATHAADEPGCWASPATLTASAG